MRKRILAVAIAASAVVAITGCSGKKDPQPVQKRIVEVHQPKPYEFRLKPQIGSRNDDARTVVDMGEVLKITLNSYKNRQGNLIASHDVYAWARKPDFIVGEELPSRRSGGTISPSGKLPYMLSGGELDRGDLKNDEVIRDYVNQVYKLEKDEQEATHRKMEASRFDNDIKAFLKTINEGEVTK